MARLLNALLVPAAAFMVLAALSCATTPPAARHRVRVTHVEIGRTLDLNDRVSERAHAFRPPDDAIYLSVSLVGPTPAASLRTRWVGPAGVMSDETRSIRLSAHEEMTLPYRVVPAGWPSGNYRVEVYLNDLEAGEKRFHLVGEAGPAAAAGTSLGASR